jgi:hypothetical protein
MISFLFCDTRCLHLWIAILANCNIHCSQNEHFLEGEAASRDPPHNRLTIHSKHRVMTEGNCRAKGEKLLSEEKCAFAQALINYECRKLKVSIAHFDTLNF